MSTINVPADFPTISLAVAASSNGDTIIVAAGIYNEQVSVNKSITLLGAQSNVDARTRVFVPANESIITFTPAPGSGIVNLSVPNITLNGFTIQGSGPITTANSAVFAGDVGVFLPSTSTIDVTGLQIIYNIIQNNANGVLIASIEPISLTPNYLVQFNYLQNNSGDPSSGDGQGVFFNNSVGFPMSKAIIDQNLFNGLETSSSVNLSNVLNSNITNNVMNQDNSISIFGTNNILINNNVTYQATGITPSFPTNTASAIFIGFNSINTTVTNNLIIGATNNGISILSGNSGILISDNCIEDNTSAGISLSNGGGPANSNIVIHDNDIMGNIVAGLRLNTGSYIIPLDLDAINNFWGSSSGPNYNGSGPGTGDNIIDNNIVATQSVLFFPFLASPITCPSPVTLSKTSMSTNVPPGFPISFTVTFTVTSSEIPFTLTSFSDPLPVLASMSSWSIITQNPPGFFVIIGAVGSQELTVSELLPATVPPGTYSVTVSSSTNTLDAGDVFNNTATTQLQIGSSTGYLQPISSSAAASVAVCIHGSSKVSLGDGSKLSISEIKSGDKVMCPDGKVQNVIEAIPCWAGIYNRIFTDCVLFERDSLGKDIPDSLLAIDSGHPVCTQEEYDKHGFSALRAAKTFVNGGSIHIVKWNEVEHLLSGPNKRYDIILPDDSCKAYIANNIVVQARKERKDPGYAYV